jgi:Lrp/AsnC family transcriptional regulator
MDKVDRQILDLLQQDAGRSIEQIAKAVNLSATPCWKRIRRLENEGVIRKRVALLDPHKVGAGMVVFVEIRTHDHSAEWLARFTEVLDFYRMAGDLDYLLRVVVPTMDAFNDFYKALIGRIPFSNVTSSFAMETIRYTTALPITPS